MFEKDGRIEPGQVIGCQEVVNGMENVTVDATLLIKIHCRDSISLSLSRYIRIKKSKKQEQRFAL